MNFEYYDIVRGLQIYGHRRKGQKKEAEKIHDSQ
jgi:hypothetical protein